ncbi:brain-enriched guanylate kinase-associated protein-like [Paramacrobiotus metropolitanus]|uniref:brain-enriched guanylate kinase-associated protein-like n=1 Tax=Paramacrobiotus metropolitanus TaxID=2943436 RepID=UPI002445DF58|nr:brain-enriched guanylate kinase-associated protein-like [Paramacrobiotus metropolitanus]
MHRSHSLTVAQSTTMESSYPDAYMLLEKYNRLLESHHRLLKVNQNLEDKLLKVVTNCEEQKAEMKNKMEAMQERMINAELRSEQLEEENVRYRRDCNLALSLLQCNPAGFVDHDFHTLPAYVRSKLDPSDSSSLSGSLNDDASDDDRPVKPAADIDILPLPFPPSAVMVPVLKKHHAIPPYRSSSNGSVNGIDQRSQPTSKRISADAIASVIQEDLRSLSSGSPSGDVRARQLTQNRQVNGAGEPGRILHV